MVNKNYCHDVSAVFVTYNPDKEVLRTAIQGVLEQVSAIFIVDNASSNFSLDWFDQLEDQAKEKLYLLRQEENLGIGAAHNIGIRQAIALGSKFVLLLDQDSQVEPDTVIQLKSAYDELSKKGGFQVAALGSQYRDTHNGVLSRFIQVGLFRNHRIHTDNPNIVEAVFLVSSGSLLPVVALEAVGLMDESLFIDGVDTEWCFRAKSKGFQVFGVYGAVMTHTLGEQRKEVAWFLRKRIVSFHKPFRYYYMFRNSILLYHRSYMPWSWKFADMARCLKMGVFFSWAAENRMEFIRMMYLGVMDGLKGISGKRNNL